jgi:hypothetical protein
MTIGGTMPTRVFPHQKTQHGHVVGFGRDPRRQAFARHQAVEIGAQRAALGRQDQRMRGDQLRRGPGTPTCGTGWPTRLTG